ncbi:hypothetical protein Mapa_003139 [Marchantia paleacea]|nr:hypothetical protein Mapa_003139 [Marchantia paleacea]
MSEVSSHELHTTVPKTVNKSFPFPMIPLAPLKLKCYGRNFLQFQALCKNLPNFCRCSYIGGIGKLSAQKLFLRGSSNNSGTRRRMHHLGANVLVGEKHLQDIRFQVLRHSRHLCRVEMHNLFNPVQESKTSESIPNSSTHIQMLDCSRPS